MGDIYQEIGTLTKRTPDSRRSGRERRSTPPSRPTVTLL